MLCRFVVLAIGLDHFSLSSHNGFSTVFVNEWALAIHPLVVAPYDLRRLLVSAHVVSLILKLMFAIVI